MFAFINIIYLIPIFWLSYSIYNKNRIELIIPGIILTSGFMINGHALVDEILLAAALFSYFLRLVLKKDHQIKFLKSLKDYEFAKFFYPAVAMFLLFFIIQCLRGAFYLDDPRMIRWIGFFGMLAVLAILLVAERQKINQVENIRLIWLSSAATYVIYLIYGLTSEYIFGVWRYYLQGYIWIGTSAMFVPLMCYLFSVQLMLNKIELTRVDKYLICAAHFIVCINAFYYESRSSQILITVFTASSFLLAFPKQIFIKVVCGLLFLLAITLDDIAKHNDVSLTQIKPSFVESIVSYLPIEVKNTSKGVSRNSQENLYEFKFGLPKLAKFTDPERILMPLAAIEVAKSDLVSAVVGSGWYTSRYEIKVKAIEILKGHGLSTGHIVDGKPTQVSGFVGLLVDTGLLGVIILCSFLLYNCFRLILTFTFDGLIIAGLLAFIIPSLFVGYSLAVLLFWILLMPCNPIISSWMNK